MVLHTSDVAHPRLISQGDLVVVYENHASMKAVTVSAEPRAQYANRYGNWSLKDWIGKPFGSKVFDKKGAWVYVLAPSPELWTQVLQHRTQILYVADISLICMGLDLRPGSVVLESGTGSGSLTHSLARAVAPSGHVHTFEFHLIRCTEAQKEFAQNGVARLVTAQHRNIEELGFPEELHGKADGVILDLPGPWKVVQSAAQCLKPNGRFCGFSPCIEQVQRTAEQLRSNGFAEVRCIECLLRYYDVRTEQLQPPCLLTQSERAAKKARHAAPSQNSTPAAPAGGCGEGNPGEGSAGKDGDAKPQTAGKGKDKPGRPVLCATPQMGARGHTGYLLFARKLVPMSVIQHLLGSGDAGCEDSQNAGNHATEGRVNE